jgi:hypothetical protein
MKTKQFTLAFLLLLCCIFSRASFAQTAPGGGSECPKSYSFTTNSGNGWGVCNGDAQIRVTFNQMPLPENIPVLTAIYYQGRPLTKIILPVGGELVTNGQGYVSYCLTGTGQKNNRNSFDYISHSVKIILEFTYPDGTVCRTD